MTLDRLRSSFKSSFFKGIFVVLTFYLFGRFGFRSLSLSMSTLLREDKEDANSFWSIKSLFNDIFRLNSFSEEHFIKLLFYVTSFEPCSISTYRILFCLLYFYIISKTLLVCFKSSTASFDWTAETDCGLLRAVCSQCVCSGMLWFSSRRLQHVFLRLLDLAVFRCEDYELFEFERCIKIKAGSISEMPLVGRVGMVLLEFYISDLLLVGWLIILFIAIFYYSTLKVWFLIKFSFFRSSSESELCYFSCSRSAFTSLTFSLTPVKNIFGWIN